MQKVKVNFTNNQKEALPENIRPLLRKAALTVLEFENIQFSCEVNVTFVTEEEIKELNAAFRNKDSVTDVLSFPMGENGEYDINPENGMKVLGDVVICVKRAFAQSVEFEHSFTREICFLTVHSLLHLLGYDHIKESDGKIMRKKEKEIMALLNVLR